MRELKLFVLAVLVVFGALATGCDSGDGAPQIGKGHPGYEATNCLGCHSTDKHNAGLRPGECAECHGNNGAPNGHGATTDCLECHADGEKAINEDHVAANHESPSDCMVCH